MKISRGEVYYIMERGTEVGSEQYAGRPAVIVSNNICNEKSPVVEVVFLTTKPKTDMPTHVTLRSLSRESTAICEQITSISVERIGNYAGCCSSQELEEIDTALLISLGLSYPPTKTVNKNVELEQTLQKTTKDLELYKTMYDTLINKLLGGSK